MRLRRVDPIEQGIRDALLIFGHERVYIDTRLERIAVISTEAGIYTSVASWTIGRLSTQASNPLITSFGRIILESNLVKLQVLKECD